MAKSTAKPKRLKAKQGFLPGTEPPVFDDVEEAAEIYHTAKIERMALSKEEDEAKDNLIDKMKENGLSIYQTADGLIVTLTATSNVKTKRKSDPDSEGGNSGDED